MIKKLNLKCILLGHKYDVKKDDKTIYCKREDKVLDLAKVGCAWDLISLYKRARSRTIMHIPLLAFMVFIIIKLLRGELY